MSIWTGLDDDRRGVTKWQAPPPKVTFDEYGMPVDTYAGRKQHPIHIDFGRFEEMLEAGKFKSKNEAVSYCREIYALIYDKDDASTHWSEGVWVRIKKSLFPDARERFDALPHVICEPSGSGEEAAGEPLKPRKKPTHKGRGGIPQSPAEIVEGYLTRGKCNNDHPIKSMDDLAIIGRAKDGGREHWGCRHCQRERTARARAKRRASKQKGK